ncbi:hypothetical protein Scep_026354 [Stephania cephalantha]|uniref:Uncharacterized protein n=1 Tax=Stephania cephalantha TaxID=152367 RepID=A0AAP0EJZ3_9MAGN
MGHVLVCEPQDRSQNMCAHEDQWLTFNHIHFLYKLVINSSNQTFSFHFFT